MSRRELPADVAIALGLAAVAVLADVYATGTARQATPSPGMPFQVAGAALLAFRRLAPATVTVLVSGLCVLTMPLALPFAAYAATAHARPLRGASAGRSPVPPRAVGVVALAVASAAFPWETAVPSQPDHAAAALTVAAGGLLGAFVRAQRRATGLAADLAAAEERERLAADLHDVITHRVSLMVLESGALGASSQDESVRRAAARIGDTGRQALRELRDLLHADRPAPERTARLDLSDLDVEPVVVGEPVELPVAVARTAYRVVQEGLTNARKHAPGAEVTVRVGYDPGCLRVQVRDRPAGGAPYPVTTSVDGGGLGLEGLRRRVETLGGELHAGPAEDGFALDVTLPTQAAAREEAG
ncbi:sensor histidine kinase [Thermoactinospora rubra]|uniref:sensor histidine kinase n=1 Tax=Thermoactinospora rubra TaxID=1088767 RepID=UPI000A101226|nr:histidine kinase [Thermoactinospora rubra]